MWTYFWIFYPISLVYVLTLVYVCLGCTAPEVGFVVSYYDVPCSVLLAQDSSGYLGVFMVTLEFLDYLSCLCERIALSPSIDCL